MLQRLALVVTLIVLATVTASIAMGLGDGGDTPRPAAAPDKPPR